MKKLFLLLTTVLLSAGMVVQAQLRDAVNDSPEGGYVFDENGQVSGRHNAPMASNVDVSFSWNELDAKNTNYSWGNCSLRTLQFERNAVDNANPCLVLRVIIANDNYVTYSSSRCSDARCPGKGTYIIQSATALYAVANYYFKDPNNNSRRTTVYDNSGNTHQLNSGTMYVEDGKDGPGTYMYIDGVGTSGETVRVRVGTPYTYYDVNVSSNNTTYGTVTNAGSYSIREGNNSLVFTANEEEGLFDGWYENNVKISSSLTYQYTNVQAAHTLEARFVENTGTQYILTVEAANSTHCTVSGGGTYYEDSQHEISATSKNEHLYFFQKWQKLNGSTYEDFVGNDVNPLSVTVTGDATYRAVYRVASDGTISATTSPSAAAGTATASPSGSLTGGTAVTLTATANDGYTFTGWDDDNDGTVDNTDPTRTVYVDGTKAYTAKFVEGVTIDVQAALNTNHGFGWGYCFYYWAKAYGYDIMIRAIDNWS